MSWDDFGLDKGHAPSADGRPNCITDWRYVPQTPKARKRLQEAVYYLERRDNHDDEDQTRHLFTGDETGVSRAAARALLREHPDRKVCFHRYILSPSTALELRTVDDFMQWTREAMDAYSAHLGVDLAWVAAVHRNTQHSHVHVLIAGSGVIREGKRAGDRRTVRIKTQDHAALKRIAVGIGERMAAEARAARRAELWRDLDAMAAAGAARQARDRQQAEREREEGEEARGRDHHQGILGRIVGRLGGRRGARGDAPGPA